MCIFLLYFYKCSKQYDDTSVKLEHVKTETVFMLLNSVCGERFQFDVNEAEMEQGL